MSKFDDLLKSKPGDSGPRLTPTRLQTGPPEPNTSGSLVGKGRWLLIILAGVVCLLALSLLVNVMLFAKLQESRSRKQKLEQQVKALSRERNEVANLTAKGEEVEFDYGLAGSVGSNITHVSNEFDKLSAELRVLRNEIRAADAAVNKRQATPEPTSTEEVGAAPRERNEPGNGGLPGVRGSPGKSPQESQQPAEH